MAEPMQDQATPDQATMTQAPEQPETPVLNVTDLVVNLEGFEGPIDLLLNLAKEQKLDLSRVSIHALAEQYLAYIAQARKLRLEIAADYLVMAAWLAFLKSRLLLPTPPAEEPNAADLAAALKFQLQRLEAMQKASAHLMDLPQLGHDVFMRGMAEKIQVVEQPVWYLPLYDLLKALNVTQKRRPPPIYALPPLRLISLEAALERLRGALGFAPSWSALTDFIPDMVEDRLEARSAIASTFAATLEMAKAGEIQIRQDGTFGPIYVRRTEPQAVLTDETKYE